MAFRTSQWVLGVAGANTFPTDGAGGGTATAGSSQLHLAKEVEIVGIFVSAAAAVTCGVVDAAGTAIPGLIADATTSGWKEFPPGVRFSNATNANVGIACGAAAVGTLFYRKIR